MKAIPFVVCLLIAACNREISVDSEQPTTPAGVRVDATVETGADQLQPNEVALTERPKEAESADPPPAPDKPDVAAADERPQPAIPLPAVVNDAELPEGLVPLNPQKTVLIDATRKRVFLKATVVLREGLLEMFACLAGTKEHESVVSVETEAYVVHTALLAVGAEPGRPVQFDPEYRPPQGQPLDIFVNWTDERGRPYRVPAQYWMRHTTRRYYLEPLAALPEDVTLPEDSELRYDEKRKELIWFGPMNDEQRYELMALTNDEQFEKLIQKFFDQSQARQMQADFVFAGSGFYEEEDGTKFYLAESGNLICVANFSDAIIDVTIRSDASNASLLFEPYTERIPPPGTEVMVELVPLFEEREI